MSTERIREALRYYERHVSAGSYGEALVAAAREEVAAIEKAARVVVREDALEDWNTAMPTELADGIRTIQTIAKESK